MTAVGDIKSQIFRGPKPVSESVSETVGQTCIYCGAPADLMDGDGVPMCRADRDYYAAKLDQ